MRDELAEQRAKNWEEFGIAPNVGDVGKPGTGAYDKDGKFVVFGPHHLGAGYPGPGGLPYGHPHHPYGGYPYAGAWPHGARYAGRGHPYAHPYHYAHHPAAYGHLGHLDPYYHPGAGYHPGYLPGDLRDPALDKAAVHPRRYAISPVRLYGSPSGGKGKRL